MSFIQYDVIQDLKDLLLVLNGSEVVIVNTRAGENKTFLIFEMQMYKMISS